MSAEPWFAFDHKLSWDGLLTFFGGLLAFFAVLYQVWRADKGLRDQLQAEKAARSEEGEEEKRAIATALLFEIDRFYRFYLRSLLKILNSTEQAHPQLEAPGSTPFPVYTANCGQIGELDSQLAGAIVDFYTSAQRHTSRICDYVEKWNAAQVDGGSTFKFRIAEFLIPGIRSGGENLIPLAYIGCAYLCIYAEIPFTTAKFDVARGEDMSEATLQAARDAMESFRARMKGNRV